MCQCLPGFTGNGLDCVPLISQSCHVVNNCSPFGVCSYDIASGQYTCYCLPGYEGDGYFCQMITTTTTTMATTAVDDVEEGTTEIDKEVEKCLLGVCWCSQGYVKLPGSIYCVRKGSELLTTTEVNTESNEGKGNFILVWLG